MMVTGAVIVVLVFAAGLVFWLSGCGTEEQPGAVPAAEGPQAEEQPQAAREAAAREAVVPLTQEQWEARVSDELKGNRALAYVTDDPALPRVLLIGDSISIGYTLTVRAELEGIANVHRAPVNCGPTTSGLAKLDVWLEPGGWDVIHFNWGLHDMRRMLEGEKNSAGRPVHTIEQYSRNLEELVRRLRETGAALIFATTTPAAPGTDGFLPEDVVAYNAAALGIMDTYGVAVDDLYGAVAGELERYQLPQNVHFKNEGSILLGKTAAAKIREVLENK